VCARKKEMDSAVQPTSTTVMAPDYKIAGEQKKKTDTSTHPNPKQFTSFGS